MLRTAIAAAAILSAAGAALAAPVTATDGAGTIYQLNDDGTYGLVVTGEDGKTYLLAPGGSWHSQDEAAALLERFGAFLDAAFARPEAPKVPAAAWPGYRACLVAVFGTLPISAQQTVLSGTDPRETFKLLKENDPESAKLLELGDQNCRKDIVFEP